MTEENKKYKKTLQEYLALQKDFVLNQLEGGRFLNKKDSEEFKKQKIEDQVEYESFISANQTIFSTILESGNTHNGPNEGPIHMF